MYLYIVYFIKRQPSDKGGETNRVAEWMVFTIEHFPIGLTIIPNDNHKNNMVYVEKSP